MALEGSIVAKEKACMEIILEIEEEILEKNKQINPTILGEGPGNVSWY